MNKPTKPTNLMPRSFGGNKNNFSETLQTNGYEDGVPAIYGGDNLNYQLDATGKELDYCEKICDFINDLPIGKTITVDSNNKLIHGDFPTVNDGTLSIQVGSTTKTFSANQATNETVTVNKSEIGLGNVDNTSDLNKPVSNATQSALDGKQDLLTFDNVPIQNSSNPVKSGGVYNAIYEAGFLKGENLGEERTSVGINWTSPSVLATGVLPSNKVNIAYGQNKFVILLNGGEIYISTDGSSWTYVGSSGDNDWGDITFDGNKFLAIKNNGYIATSIDGETWTVAANKGLSSQPDYWKIIFGNGLYVAMGDKVAIGNRYDTYIATSTDGENWTMLSGTYNHSDMIRGMAYGEGRFIALDYEGNAIISTDGTNWTVYNNALYLMDVTTNNVDALWEDIEYAEGYFIALARYKYVAFSKDGINWLSPFKMQFTDSSSVSNYFSTLAYGNGKLISTYIGGDNVEYITSNKSLALEPLFPYVKKYIEAENGTYWAKIYSNGWVRQGGHFVATSTATVTINLPVRMSTAIRYVALTTYEEGTGAYGQIMSRTSTSISVRCYKENGMNWIVEGMSA